MLRTFHRKAAFAITAAATALILSAGPALAAGGRGGDYPERLAGRSDAPGAYSRRPGGPAYRACAPPVALNDRLGTPAVSTGVTPMLPGKARRRLSCIGLLSCL